MTFKTKQVPQNTEMHVITYVKQGDTGHTELMYITAPEFGAAVRIINGMARDSLMQSNDLGQLSVAFMTNAIDMKLRARVASDTMGDASLADITKLFVSEVGPVDQSIIAQCTIAEFASIASNKEVTLITFDDAVYSAPTMEELVDSMRGPDLLRFLEMMFQRDGLPEPDLGPLSDSDLLGDGVDSTHNVDSTNVNTFH